MQRTLNLGLLAHVDAGKTTLTERLLYAAGVIDEIGSVDAGTTQTDYLALERQRGITIRSAVASFAIGDVTVNLIDTPGHPDFIAEVERVLSVLDGAVLVISAVEGVQAQTHLLLRALRRLNVPTLLFVNKIDRAGARDEPILQEIAERLTPTIVALGSVRDIGTRKARFLRSGETDEPFVSALASALSEGDDTILIAYVEDEASLSHARLQAELAAQTKQGLVHPVLFGSARTGSGVDSLLEAIIELLPATAGVGDGPVRGSVFKIERGSKGEKIAYVRMFSGTVRARERLHLSDGTDGKVTAISVFADGSSEQRASVSAGEVAKLWGLGSIRVGDPIGEQPAQATHHFAPPTLETVVVPSRVEDKGRLRLALDQLAEQDPLIKVRQDDGLQELYVSLYGEVQKEIVQQTLALEFDVDVEFRETTPICIERPLGVGHAIELLGRRGNPFLATVGLRVEPGPVDSGLGLKIEVDTRAVPLYVFKSVESFGHAVEETVRETLRQGIHGWHVTDCMVTMTDSGYASPSTTAGDFRKLIPLVLMEALQHAGTEVCEPVHRFRLEGPADGLAPALRVLAQLQVDPLPPTVSRTSFVVDGSISAARMHLLQQQVRGLTHGEGLIEFAFDRYQTAAGEIPTRRRTDYNPLNREEYLLHLARRIG